MRLSIFVGSLAGFCYLLAYADYNRGIFSGRIKPNGATWGIWSMIAVLSAGSYFTVSGDFWKSILQIVNILPCIGTFLLALFAGKFQKLGLTDWLASLITVLAVGVWAICKSAAWTNVIVQGAIVIGFIPIWRSVWTAPSLEHRRPWVLWTISYSLAAAVVVLRWNGQWIDLVSPLNCIVLHASVPVLCSLRASVDEPPEGNKPSVLDASAPA